MENQNFPGTTAMNSYREEGRSLSALNVAEIREVGKFRHSDAVEKVLTVAAGDVLEDSTFQFELPEQN